MVAQVKTKIGMYLIGVVNCVITLALSVLCELGLPLAQLTLNATATPVAQIHSDSIDDMSLVVCASIVTMPIWFTSLCIVCRFPRRINH